MRSIGSGIGAAVSLSLLVASAAFAQPFGPTDEVLLVEPTNVPLLLVPPSGPGAGGLLGFQEVFEVPAVCRPANICGGAPTDTTPIQCYEFLITYSSFLPSGQQVLRLPQCNGVDRLDPACDDPANNLCVGSTFPVSGPVCGELRVDALPLTTSSPLTLGLQASDAWDGITVSPLHRTWIETKDNGVFHNRSYHVPIVRMNAASVTGLSSNSPVLAALIGRHTNLAGTSINLGFFEIFNREFMWDQTLGNISNTMVTPVVFMPGTTCGP